MELNRGWNSRLGFSLKLNESTQRTYISAIYSDSVAARDGRLRIGDEILTVGGRMDGRTMDGWMDEWTWYSDLARATKNMIFNGTIFNFIGSE